SNVNQRRSPRSGTYRAALISFHYRPESPSQFLCDCLWALFLQPVHSGCTRGWPAPGQGFGRRPLPPPPTPHLLPPASPPLLKSPLPSSCPTSLTAHVAKL